MEIINIKKRKKKSRRSKKDSKRENAGSRRAPAFRSCGDHLRVGEALRETRNEQYREIRLHVLRTFALQS